VARPARSLSLPARPRGIDIRNHIANNTPPRLA
jgi:hypothetical protein